MEVKLGFKQTEAGVIPDEWEAKQLRDVAALNRLNVIPASFPDQLFVHFSLPAFDAGKVPIVEPGSAIGSNKFRVPQGAILVSKLNPRIPRIWSPDEISADAIASTEFLVLTPKEEVSRSFLFAICSSSLFCEQMELAATGTTGSHQRISPSGALALKVLVPIDIDEQRAIAAALGDVDALIGALDQLIAKKRDLKQAAMQQLLTGQTRLPGFNGKWEVKRLGDLFTFSGGYSASRDQLSTEGHCYLHYGDIHKSSKTYINVRAEYQDIPKLDIPLKRVSSGSLLDDGDVVFVDASEDDEGTSKHVVVINKDKTTYISGLHTIVAKSKTEEIAHEYRHYCFQTAAIRRQFLFYAVGTKVSGISKTNIAKLTLPVPPLPEQTAIARVLTDMDVELAALEQCRDKTRALKQGMMQELLTGKTRLI